MALLPFLAAGEPQAQREYTSRNGHHWARVWIEGPSGDSGERGWKLAAGDFRWRLFHHRRVALALDGVPWKVLVSDKGDRIVVLHDVRGRPPYAHLGGIRALTIYTGDGTLVRALTLDDLFTRRDLEVIDSKLNTVVSDGQVDQDWVYRGELDEPGGRIWIRAPRQHEDSRHETIPIDLATGAPLEVKRDRLWQERFFDEAHPVASGKPELDLLKDVLSRPPLEYPPLAKVARICGTVEVEVRVDSEGRVVRAWARQGPVQLLDSTENALYQWRFKPSPDGHRSTRSGWISVRFGGTETRP